MAKLLCTLSLIGFTLACQPLPEPPPHGARGPTHELTLEPPAALDSAPPVVRLRIGFSGPPSEAAEDYLLISGELSDYHLGRIRQQDLPNTLLERIVPVVAWTEEQAVVLAPSVALESGTTFTLASPLSGRIAAIRIASESAPLFERVWPPKQEGLGSTHAVYCGTSAPQLEDSAPSFDPGAQPAEAAVFDRCLMLSTLAVPPLGARLVPQPLFAGVALDPAPLEHAEHLPPQGAICLLAERAFGPGCARVEDDRIIIRSRPEAALWLVTGPQISALETVAADGRFVLRGLTAASTTELDLSVFDLSGRETTERVSVETTAPRLRLVIDEVLANALGPEPQQEWIELVNDGQLPVETLGFSLEDLGGVTLLPTATIAPGERALVVREDFALDDGLDVPVPPGTQLLRVERLGKNGLGNSGEPLVLRAPDGSVVSRFPAALAGKGGVSIARRRAWDLDDDPSAFAPHADPGASPGGQNVVE